MSSCERFDRAGPPSDRPGDVVEVAESQLRKNGSLTVSNVFCTFREGVLTLHGCLPTYYLWQTAQELVAGLPGVRAVNNQIEIVSAGRGEWSGSPVPREMPLFRVPR